MSVGTYPVTRLVERRTEVGDGGRGGAGRKEGVCGEKEVVHGSKVEGSGGKQK